MILKAYIQFHSGQPPPNVTWWTKDTLLDDTFEVTPYNNIRNELLISKLSRDDFFLELTCKAWNSYLTVPLESSIILELNCEYH